MKKKFFSKLLMVALVATVGAFSSCKDYDDDIADVRNQINVKASELTADYTAKINLVNSTISEMNKTLDALDAAYKQADTQLQANIDAAFKDAVAQAKAYSDTNKKEALDAAAAAQAAAEAVAREQAAAAQKAAIAAAQQALDAAVKELNDKLAKANELIATQGQTISNLLEADKILTNAVTTAQSRADQAYALADKANTLAETNKSNLEKALGDITALKTDLANLQGSAAKASDVTALQEQLTALQKTVSDNVVSLSDYKESITKLTSDLGTLKEDLANQVSFLGENIAAVKKTAEDNVAAIDAIKTQLASLAESNTQAHEQIIASVASLAQTVENNKTAASDALKAAMDGVEAKLAAAGKLISDNTDAIANLTADVKANKEAQDKINEAIKGDVAKNAENIIANSNDIKRLNEIIPELQSTLEKYADKVAKDAADQAKEAAQNYALDQIQKQAEADKKAWETYTDAAVDALIKTYQLNSLSEIIQAAADKAQTNAETNAAAKAQEIANKALADAIVYTDALAQTLKDNYTTTTDMQAQIEAAKQSAIAQAYVKVLNDLLRDQEEWFNQTDDMKLTELSPTIFEVAKKAVNEFGVSQENAEALMNKILDAALEPSVEAAMGVEAKEGGKIMVLIEAAAKKAADDLDKVNNELCLRLDDIEAFLNTTSGAETLDATINFWIAEAKLAKQADVDELKAMLAGTKDSELLNKITTVTSNAQQNAADIAKVMTSINKVTAMFSFLTPAEESNVSDNDLKAYENVMQKLADRIAGMADIVDNLDDKVMDAVNKNLGPQIQTMITSINLFANQHMAERDQQGKIAQFDGENWIYPYGYDNFDHTLTFMYTIESGLYGNYCKDANGNLPEGSLTQEGWNYPDGLIKQLKTISSERDQQYPNDYNFSYDEGGFTGSATDYDFVDGRYRSYDDSILVRVSPTNADLSKAEIALLNSKGEDIINAGLVELLDVKPYTRNTYIVREANEQGGKVSPTTRAAEGNATGLWVIKFKLNDSQVGTLWNKYAYAKTTKDNKEQLTGSILYAVAVKNTDFSTEETADVDRYVVSEYDLDLDTAEPEHAWEFFANGTSIDDIHNRYIMSEEAPNGETSWTDDPENYTSTFRYELTWHDLACDAPVVDPDEPEVPVVLDNTHPAYYTYCFDCWCLPGGEIDDDCEDKDYGYKHPAYSSILFKGEMDNYTEVEQKGVNTCDRHEHTFADDGKRQMNGIDNRHQMDFLPITFDYDMPGETDGVKWAKIDIEFPATNNCGVPTPIRGFFVTLDNHFAIESQNSEINAWAQYIYKNVAAYNYDHHVKKTVPADATDAVIDRAIVLQPGNKGSIYIKDAANILNDEIVGFRVHAVNLDGTLVDPDGRAFYVKIGKKTTNHELSFNVLADTLESYAVQNADENGKNPIAAYNELMKSEGSSDRFFNQPAYNSSYVDSREYKVIYTWRGENPAIRGYLEDAVNAWIPVAGTGRGVENAYNTTHTVVNHADPNYTNTTPLLKAGDAKHFDVEEFFNFYYSENAAATAEDSKDNDWKTFNKNVPLVPNQKTMSMRASIKKGMANRLIDNATYHITMTILRNDAQTVWSIVNTYDIDITKDMPTDLPANFYVKSNQLAGGAWTFYMRPYAEVDFAAAASDGDNNNDDPDEPGTAPGGEEAASDPWAITWGEYGVDVKSNNFASIFNAEEYTDADGNKQKTNLHNYRWAMDTRMYNFEGMFNGLYIDEIGEDGKPTGNKTIDQNYYFVFEKAGSYAGATYDIENGATEAKADADNAAKDAIATFDTEYDVTKVNQGSADADLTHEKGAYTLPLIHWSLLGKTVNVKAGYIYRNISANLDANGYYFLQPSAEKAGKTGLAITNDDYELASVAMKLGTKRDGAQVKATFKCALGTAITFTADGTENKFEYNQDIAVDATAAKFKLSGDVWEAGNDKQAYFNTQFDASWTKSAAGTLADWLKTPWCWIDLASLKFTATAPAGYRYEDYYEEPYFICGDAKFDSEENTFQDITGIGMMRNARTEGLPDFKNDVIGNFTFDIYDVWFHKKNVTINVKVTKPTNTTARQAR